MSIFTQKHYEFLMRELRNDDPGNGLELMEKLCKALQKDNPKFKRDVFVSGISLSPPPVIPTGGKVRSRRAAFDAAKEAYSLFHRTGVWPTGLNYVDDERGGASIYVWHLDGWVVEMNLRGGVEQNGVFHEHEMRSE